MKDDAENKDKYLVIKANQGDTEAFGKLFDKYSAKIYRFIYYKVSSAEIAEDFTSQCFLKIWEQISSGAKVRSFQSWMYKIARNLVIDYYRSREREELPLIYQEEEIQSEVKVDPDKNLDKDFLEKVLLNLNVEVREIITLRFIEELSIKEIAKIVDKSPANVRVIIHRALKELNKYVE
ncbi:MAG TPA: RNA polymerase sigma factor [Patescibacteria group bacterium]|nr:RNA polymerase sigma factor [Patescibacteria group bacterium]